jgi:hypothetical protein
MRIRQCGYDTCALSISVLRANFASDLRVLLTIFRTHSKFRIRILTMATEHERAAEATLSGPSDCVRSAAPAKHFARHWRGDFPLGFSIWLNGTLALFSPRLLFTILIATAAAWGARAGAVQATAWGWTLIFALWIALLIWANVGIWRSAARHVERGGQHRWARAAKLFVIVAASLETLLVTLVAHSPRFDAVSIALGRDPDGQAAINVSSDGRSVAVYGALGAGFATRLASKLHTAVGVRTLLLNSPGGRLYEALAAAKEVRTFGLDTRATRQCDSACTLLFLAGRERSAAPGTIFTFHKASLFGVNASEQWLEANLAAFRDAGLAPTFLAHYRALREGELWVPRPAELIAYNVLTSSSPPRR